MHKGWEEFEDRIREAMQDVEVPLDVDLFPNIQEALQRRQWVRLVRRIGVSVAAAAVLVVGWIALAPQTEPTIDVLTQPETPMAVVTEPVQSAESLVVSEPVVVSEPEKMAEPVKKSEPVVLSKSVVPSVETVVPAEEPKEEVAPKSVDVVAKQGDETPQAAQKTIAENLYLAQADETSAAQTRRNWSMGLASTLQGGLTGGTNNYNPMASVAPGSGQSFQVGERSLQPLTTPTHHFPLTLAVQLQWSLAENWSMGTGLSYSRLHSQYEALHNNQLQVDVDQTLHYLGIPLFFNYSILRNQHLNVYASVGGMVEKALCMDFQLRDLSNKVIRECVSVNGVQTSLHLGLGLEYRFLQWMGLFVDPSLAYYFDHQQPMNLRTAQSLQMRLDVGLRFFL